MLKSALLDAIRTEIRRHDLSHFQNEKDKIVVLPAKLDSQGLGF